MVTIITTELKPPASTLSVRSLDEAAKVELARKIRTIMAYQNISYQDARQRAISWQLTETGDTDEFSLMSEPTRFTYRVWYTRQAAEPGYVEVLIRTQSRLYQWASIYSFLTYWLRNTYDATCESVITFVESQETS